MPSAANHQVLDDVIDFGSYLSTLLTRSYPRYFAKTAAKCIRRSIPHHYHRSCTTTASNAKLSRFEMQHKTPPVKKVTPIPIAYYGGRHTVTLLPGAGIGPELASYVKEIFSYAGVPVDFETIKIDPHSDTCEQDFDCAIVSIRRNGVALKGNIDERGGKNYDPNCTVSRDVRLRNELDLYVNVLRCKSYPGVVEAKFKDVDLVILRQNIEGEYTMLEHESVVGVVESMKVITRINAERISRYAFEYARRHGRKKVTTIHKANIMKLSDGLFLRTSRELSKDYPDIAFDDMIIDDACAKLVVNPYQFDVLLAINLYGSVLTNVVCGLTGGPGLASGKNYGDHYAIFEPATRNTATTLVGQNLANPITMLNASTDMLRHLGRDRHAALIQNAIDRTVNRSGIRTRDLGGSASSRDVVDSVLRCIKRELTIIN